MPIDPRYLNIGDVWAPTLSGVAGGAAAAGLPGAIVGGLAGLGTGAYSGYQTRRAQDLANRARANFPAQLQALAQRYGIGTVDPARLASAQEAAMSQVSQAMAGAPGQTQAGIERLGLGGSNINQAALQSVAQNVYNARAEAARNIAREAEETAASQRQGLMGIESDVNLGALEGQFGAAQQAGQAQGALTQNLPQLIALLMSRYGRGGVNIPSGGYDPLAGYRAPGQSPQFGSQATLP